MPLRRCLLVLVSVVVVLMLVGAERTSSATAAAAGVLCPPSGCPGAALPGPFIGRMSQGTRVRIDVTRDGGAVIAVRFAVLATCSRSRIRLKLTVRRGADPWAILDANGHGFSDWFAGPTGHAFHLTGTFSADARAATGTLHLRARLRGRGMCDSGHVSWAVRAGAGPPLAPERGGTITLAAYRSVTVGASLAAVLARLGAPADRVSIAPAGLLAAYGQGGGLVYRRAGHPQDLLGYVIRGGRVAVRGL